MSSINLLNGNALELMKDIPDNSVDLILTDPPYNIGKAKWDKIPNYIEWCGKWFIECQRVLKDNGSFYWWQNDMVQIAQLMEWLRNNSDFVFNSFITWDKGDFWTNVWKNPSDKINLRSWFNTCEYCLFYTFQGKAGLPMGDGDTNNFPNLVHYFHDLKEFIGLGIHDIDSRLGHQGAKHCFHQKSIQWALPTPKTYQELIDVFDIDEWQGFREYESLRQEYESLRYTYNLDKNHNNVWHSNEHNSGKRHPTQKPIDLMERIIKTSSNQGDTVLDLFMGSGSTGVACVNTNRNFIGMELDKDYFKIAEKRINDANR